MHLDPVVAQRLGEVVMLLLRLGRPDDVVEEERLDVVVVQPRFVSHVNGFNCERTAGRPGSGSDERRFIGFIPNDRYLGFVFFRFEDHRGPADGKLAHSAVAKASADHYALDVLPLL